MRLSDKFARFIASKILKRKDLSDVFWDRIPDFKTFIKTSINHLFYFARIPYAPFLTSLMIEVTNRCNLQCIHCPSLNMKRKKGNIDPELVKRIIDENKNLSYIYFYDWGEPFLHPDLWDMVRYASERGIKTSVITNGTLLDEKIGKSILESGLSTLSFSIDGVGTDYEKKRGFNYNKLKSRILAFIDMKKRHGSKTPHLELNVVLEGNDEDKLRDIEFEWKGNVDVINYQPLILFDEFLRNSPCRELWKGNLVVLWDGSVVPCCVDYDGELVVGDAKKEKLADVFRRVKIRKFRAMHRKGTYMPLCRKCSEAMTNKASKRFN
jgi:radical SAM protein with 4Fe4S-binding SPASM domain